MEFINKNKKTFGFAFWFWIANILYFTLINNSLKLSLDINEQSYRLDYILHFIVYFNLAILYLLWKANRYLNVKPIFLTYFLIGGILISGLSEYAQSFIPGRTFNPFDFYSNVLGIILGVIIPKLVINKVSAKHRQ